MCKSRVRENIIRQRYSEFSRKELEAALGISGVLRPPCGLSSEFCCFRLLLALEGNGTVQRTQKKAVENSGKSRKIRLSMVWWKTIFCSQKSAASLLVFSMDCTYLLCFWVMLCFCAVNWKFNLNRIAWFPILFRWGGCKRQLESTPSCRLVGA